MKKGFVCEPTGVAVRIASGRGIVRAAIVPAWQAGRRHQPQSKEILGLFLLYHRQVGQNALQMSPDSALSFDRIATGNGLNHIAMLVDQPVYRKVRTGQEAHPIHLRLHFNHDVPGFALACALGQGAMKGFVSFHEIARRTADQILLTVNLPPQVGYQRGIRRLRQQSDDIRLDRFAHEAGIHDIGKRNLGNICAALRADFQQALIGKSDKGFTHRLTAGAVLQGNISLRNPGAGVQGVVNDRGPQSCVELIHNAGVQRFQTVRDFSATQHSESSSADTNKPYYHTSQSGSAAFPVAGV
ncbi:hypothetical protein J2X53_003533 [Pseudorhodobacter sp. 4114]|nr:hypothetical protein [Pseudorhodobacter sp. 4114]